MPDALPTCRVGAQVRHKCGAVIAMVCDAEPTSIGGDDAQLPRDGSASKEPHIQTPEPNAHHSEEWTSPLLASSAESASKGTRLLSVWTGTEPGLVAFFTSRTDTPSMTLATNWEPTPGMTGVHYDERVVLESRFEGDRPVLEHMLEQQKVRDLLIVMRNAPAYFRRHRVRSESIYEQSSASETRYSHPVDMIGGFAAHEQGNPQPVRNSGDFAIVYPGQFGPEGFENWAQNYERLERVIRPLVRILQRPQALAEDRVVAVGMALEAAGARLPKVEGERETYRRPAMRNTTVATSIFRVLAEVGIATDRFAASPVGLARAIADSYNAIKHPNRDLPSGFESHGVAALGTLVLRIYLAKKGLGYQEPVTERYGDHFVDQAGLLWEHLGIYVGPDGRFIPRDLPSLWSGHIKESLGG